MRLREFNVCVGVTGSGKSSWLARLIRAYQQNVIVLKHTSNIDDPAFSFLPHKTTFNFRQGAASHEPVQCKMTCKGKKDYKLFMQWVLQHYRNGLLIIDDAIIFEKDRMTDELLELVTLRRFYGVDVWQVYHGLSLFPIDQFVFLDHVILFNTSDKLEYKKNKIPCFDQLEAARTQARNNYNHTDPAIKYRPVILNLRKLN